MATCDGMNLLEQHNWFTSALQAQGTGQVGIPKRDVVLSGPACVVQSRRNDIDVELKVHEESQENVDFLEIAMSVRQFEALEVKTSEGVYKASKTGCSRISAGDPPSLTLTDATWEFLVSDEKPRYWVLPLSNFISHFLQRGELVGQHPLRIDPDARIVEFLWQGMPAFIEPLLDYNLREKLLEKGEVPYLLTAVMVGEIGDNPTDVDGLETWFPAVLLRVLGFATGHDVSAPWVEFRDAEGKLVNRVHWGMGAPDFDKGRRVIEEHPHPLTAIFAAAEQNVPLTVKVTQNHLRMLLEAVQRTPFCQTSTYFVLLHQALLAGTYGGQKSDERLTLLFRAFDCLCKEHGFKKIVWQDDLQANDKTEEMRILNEASKEIRVLAKEAGKRGDSKGVTALGKIAQRVMTADQTDRDFGRAMSMLVGHFKFHDEAVMDAYFAANPLSTASTWAGVLSLYRNAAIHNGFFDTSNPDFSTEKLHYMNVHLHDLLARILLVMSGYDGPYHPTPKIWVGSQDYIDRIQPGSPAIELGYE